MIVIRIGSKIIGIATYVHIYSFTGGIHVRLVIHFRELIVGVLPANRLFHTWRLKAAVLRRKVTRILRSGAQQVSLKLIIGFSYVIALTPLIDWFFFFFFFLSHTTLLLIRIGLSLRGDYITTNLNIEGKIRGIRRLL